MAANDAELDLKTQRIGYPTKLMHIEVDVKDKRREKIMRAGCEV